MHLVTIHKSSKKFIGTIMIHYIDTREGCACEKLSPGRLKSWKIMTSYQTIKFENGLLCTVTYSYDIRSCMTRRGAQKKADWPHKEVTFFICLLCIHPSLKRLKLSHME